MAESLANTMFKSASRNIETSSANEGPLTRGAKAGAELALNKQKLGLEREKMEQAKIGAKMKRYEMIGKGYKDLSLMPADLQDDNIDNSLAPMAEQLGIKIDTKTLKSVMKSKNLDRAKLGGLLMGLEESIKNKDFAGASEKYEEVMRVTANDAPTIQKYALDAPKRVADKANADRKQHLAEGKFANDKVEFKVNKQLNFAENKTSFMKTHSEKLHKMDINQEALDKGMRDIDQAVRENNGQQLNQIIKNIVKTTDNRITDKDFELIAHRLGIYGLYDKGQRAMGKVPVGAAEALKDIIRSAQDSQVNKKKLYFKGAKSHADSLAAQPFATSDSASIMGELSGYDETMATKSSIDGESGRHKEGKALDNKIPLSSYYKEPALEKFTSQFLKSPHVKNDKDMILARIQKTDKFKGMDLTAQTQLAAKFYKAANEAGKSGN